MKKEIGGYLELEQLKSNEYYNNLISLNTGRNALVYILKSRNIKKLYIPYYLCDSVSAVCEREGYLFDYYRTNVDFTPIFDSVLNEGEYLYIVNYYGQLSNEILSTYKDKFKNIIIDNVQAFFQKPISGIDTIYSCRKFFGVPDGAYLSTDCLLNEELKFDVSAKRIKHLLGRLEYECASDFYQNFRDNDESFKELRLKRMSKLTHNILGAVDYDNVMMKREENFRYLHNVLGNRNKLNISIPAGPYAYPFYSKNGIKLRKRLAENRVYVPTLWPNVLNSSDKVALDYAKNILPLPCDQRYSAKEMDYILSILNN